MSYRDLANEGCHGNGGIGMDRFYYPGVSVPKSMDGCSDDFVMVEFGRAIRFYYVYRPWIYSDEAILTTYEKLGVTIREDIPRRGIPCTTILISYCWAMVARPRVLFSET